SIYSGFVGCNSVGRSQPLARNLIQQGRCCMQVRLHVLAVFTVALLLGSFALAQTPATGTVTIQGWDLGPVYPCGNSSCPTYDSGMVQLTVGGFTVTTGFSHTIGQSTSEALAIKLANQLNAANSPVVATRSNT